MPINPEGAYEDSYQQRDRLEEELGGTMAEIEKFFDVAENKDEVSVARAFVEDEKVQEKLNELSAKERELETRLKEKKEELVALNKSNLDIDRKIDAANALMGEIDDIREKINATDTEMIALIRRQMELAQEIAAAIGDVNGTVSVIELLLEKAENIKKQLDELDAWGRSE